MSMMFGMFSYLPDNSVRLKRKKYAIDAFENYGHLAQICGQPLYVVTTNWSDKEWEECVEAFARKRIRLERLVCTLVGKGASIAKNMLFNAFYDSDCDYLFAGDDDCQVYSHYDSDGFIQDLHFNSEKFIRSKVFAFTSFRSNILPYKEVNLNNPDFPDNYVFQYKNIGCLNGPYVIVNTRKYFDGKRALITGYENKLPGYRDDLSFAIELMKLKIVLYTCSNFIGADRDQGKNSTLHIQAKNDEQLMEYQKALNSEFSSVYPKVTYGPPPCMFPNIKAYLPVQFSRYILVRRKVPYVFVDSDKPKFRSKKVNLGLLK